LRGIGGKNKSGAGRLVSFLLFEKQYTKRLIELGYNDAMAVKRHLLNFINGEEVPRLVAPEWIKTDLKVD